MTKQVDNEMIFNLLMELKADFRDLKTELKDEIKEMKRDTNRRFDEVDRRFDEIDRRIDETRDDQKWMRNKIEALWETRKELKLSFDRSYFPRFAGYTAVISFVCYVIFEVGKNALKLG